jgi:hypothetical protein
MKYIAFLFFFLYGKLFIQLTLRKCVGIIDINTVERQRSLLFSSLIVNEGQKRKIDKYKSQQVGIYFL